jgi:hypothetical protein
VTSITTQDNSDLGDKTNITNAGDQFAKANKKENAAMTVDLRQLFHGFR